MDVVLFLAKNTTDINMKDHHGHRPVDILMASNFVTEMCMEEDTDESG